MGNPTEDKLDKALTDIFEDYEMVGETHSSDPTRTKDIPYLKNKLIALIKAQQTALIERIERELDTNGAVIHDCGRRVDDVLQTKRTAEILNQIKEELS